MRIDVSGLTQAHQNLREMAERVRDLSPAMKVGAEAINKLISDSFRQSRSPDGTPWDPLLPATIKRRRKGSSKPLLNTGRLANSNTATGGPRSITFGTNVAYAGYHQFGTKHIPQRAFLPIELAGGKFSLMQRGPALQTLERIRAAIARYVTKGGK